MISTNNGAEKLEGINLVGDKMAPGMTADGCAGADGLSILCK